jgi:hypothetical protein
MASEDVAISAPKEGTVLAKSSLKSHNDDTSAAPEDMSGSEILRLLGGPSDTELRKPRSNFGTSSVTSTVVSDPETRAAQSNDNIAEDEAVQETDRTPRDATTSTLDAKPEDFMGSVEFWDVWRRRQKKACEEEGKCSCFEGIGSMF